MTALVGPARADAAINRIEWLQVDTCPVCSAPQTQTEYLPEGDYVFGDERIRFPSGGVSVASCSICGLIYKTCLPAPESLAQIFERQAGKKWMEPFDFRDETSELQRIAGDKQIDLLDVGSGNGALLAAWTKRTSRGRRSALDVIQHPGCAERISGEFIRGLIESKYLRWSGKPYDVVTLFDVMEHLYSPQNAFRNLRDLVRNNGIVIIETGNVDSEWPQRYGAHHWWYVRLFEHHLFWSRRSLEYIAAQFGFRLLVWRELRHKTRATTQWSTTLKDLAQVSLYRLAPRLYPHIAPLLGKHWTQPWSPFTRDHFRVILRKT